MVAAKRGDSAVVKVLVDAGAEKNTQTKVRIHIFQPGISANSFELRTVNARRTGGLR
jgi:hypothetical protein